MEMEGKVGKKKNKGKPSTKKNKSNVITGHFIENTSYRTL